ncbi:hypothetical protein [Pseudolysinimonas yzui]|uniref:hypothetical protein n=1 Tax=Pseudolysinimonas yzui TaxID=2708254 RepID=UPI0017499C43|nr:hypothetical protein [Pseudolysinimonas yzui]
MPFTPETWNTLQALADTLGVAGRRVAPAQLAASLVEDGVAELDAAIQAQKAARKPHDGPGSG